MAAKKKTAEKSDDEAKRSPGEDAQPVTVDNHTVRSDDEALEGSWVEIVKGDHEGVRGSFAQVVTRDPKTGYPSLILVKARDFAGDVDQVVVDYADVRPAAGYSGGR